jgi:multiple sugar transport system ATP-binding protein
MVFQSYALYPHMNVERNMSFSMALRKERPEKIRQAVEGAAASLELKPYLDRLPKALSGGQRQRVAMGRAIVRRPKVFLFDEPLSNLDAQLRVQMRTEVRKLHQRLEATSVYVTHDQVEAMTMADRIVVLDKGRIAQSGTPLELYDRPANRFVAEFIGSPAINLFPCEVKAGRLFLPSDEGGIDIGPTKADEERIELGVRPEHLKPVKSGGLPGTVQVIENLGAETYVILNAAGRDVCWRIAGRPGVSVGDRLRLGFDPAHMHFFSAASGVRL